MDLESEIDIYYDCDECDQTFPSDNKMRDHKQKAHVVKYRCHLCDSNFKDLTILQNHIFTEHSEPEPVTLFPCDFCEESFIQRSQLNEHLNEHHSSQKLHCCKECKKAFFSRTGLKHHVRIVHECKMRYSCPDCSQCFRRESTLERHIDKEHLKLGKESLFYKCDECGKSLPNGCLFHVCKNEIPLTCEECGDSFSNSIDFKSHKKTVHPRLKYPCVECKRCFSSNDKLNSHYKYHHVAKYLEMQSQKVTIVNQANDNVKKHKCEFCVIAFARPENLKRHVQRMHKSKVEMS